MALHRLVPSDNVLLYEVPQSEARAAERHLVRKRGGKVTDLGAVGPGQVGGELDHNGRHAGPLDQKVGEVGLGGL